jgi:hypothetical protein
MDELDELKLLYGNVKLKKMFEDINKTLTDKSKIKGKIIIIGTGGEDNNFKDFKDLI